MSTSELWLCTISHRLTNKLRLLIVVHFWELETLKQHLKSLDRILSNQFNFLNFIRYFVKLINSLERRVTTNAESFSSISDQVLHFTDSLWSKVSTSINEEVAFFLESRSADLDEFMYILIVVLHLISDNSIISLINIFVFNFVLIWFILHV